MKTLRLAFRSTFVSMHRWAVVVTLALLAGMAQATLLFDNFNTYGVSNGPSVSTVFTITSSMNITTFMTYHWNGGNGDTPGTLTLKHSDGTVYGPWTATGHPDARYYKLYAYTYPKAVIKAGTYTVIDSNTSTWSYNSNSGNAGFAQIEGDEVAQSSGATAANTSADCLFSWAEKSYPAFFSPSGTISQDYNPYYFRYYSKTKAYLATSTDNHAYYLGPLTNNGVTDLGLTSQWLALAGCDGSSTGGPVGGGSISVPAGVTSGAVSLITAATTLALPTDKSMAATVTINSNQASLPRGNYGITLPLKQTPTNPAKLVGRMLMPDGTLLPVLGRYSSKDNTFTITVSQPVDGASLSVVEAQNLSVSTKTRSAVRAESGSTWENCEFVIVDHSGTLDSDTRDLIWASSTRACNEFQSLGFAAPTIAVRDIQYVNGQEVNVRARVVHAMDKIPTYGDAAAGLFDFKAAEDYTDANYAKISQANSNVSGSGEMYASIPAINNARAYGGIDVVSHELFHSIQFSLGKDKGTICGLEVAGTCVAATDLPYCEGTAALVGSTFLAKGGYLNSGAVPWATNTAQLDFPLDMISYTSPDIDLRPYSKADFFAYVANRYAGGSLAYLNSLFASIYGVQGATTANDYKLAYRTKADQALRNTLNVGLSEAYMWFAIDRAFLHSQYAKLRDADTQIHEFTINKDVFSANSAWTMVANASETIKDIAPLSTKLITATIDPSLKADLSTGTKQNISLTTTVSGGELKDGGVRVVQILQTETGDLIGEPTVLTTNPQTVSWSASQLTNASQLSVLIVNSHIEDKTAEVVLSLGEMSIITLSPGSGAIGTAVTITGSGFGTTQGSVTFGGVSATASSWTDTSITTTVPSGLATGYVDVVVTAAGVQSNTKTFSVTAATTGGSGKLTIKAVVTGGGYGGVSSSPSGLRCGSGGDSGSACTATFDLNNASYIINSVTVGGWDYFNATHCSNSEVQGATCNCSAKIENCSSRVIGHACEIFVSDAMRQTGCECTVNYKIWNLEPSTCTWTPDP